MDKGSSTVLPAPASGQPAAKVGYRRTTVWKLSLTAIALLAVSQWTAIKSQVGSQAPIQVPIHAEQILDKCRLLNVKPGPPEDFNLRKSSDRFVPGTKPTLIKNATIWTGRLNGLEILEGDILLQNGLVKSVGVLDDTSLANLRAEDLVEIDANGAWVSPGIVDMHSHLAVDSSPALRGSNDGNSRHGPVLPWLRALDGMNTHDDAYRLSISGGVTTALVLPGSANAIGGQGILIKLRPTAERSPTSMLLENPYSTNTSEYDPHKYFRFRQMKHACGENPDRVYSGTRMDTTWAFRQAYNKAREIKIAQDEYCSKALNGKWSGLAAEFPEEYQWEALVDVLRGRVKVHNHCYETVDLDDMVRITNEFEFHIAAFHHAHETYLVPETLKAAYGGPPAIAMFATNARYKRESYRGSEFAPRILANNSLQVVMKSDHPVLDSRFLLYEAQQAHYFGLDANLALLSITGTPAQIIGQDHRVGFIQKGYDADIVLWDSHPLALGATPQQVWIDGIAQIATPHVHQKPEQLQHAPRTPNFDKEAQQTLQYDGLPPLLPEHSDKSVVVFTNVSEVLTKSAHEISVRFSARPRTGMVVVEAGEIVCAGPEAACGAVKREGARFIDLQGGTISPGLLSFGSPLGLQEIQGEASTADGYVLDPLLVDSPKIVGGERTVIHAIDGLQFTTRDALLAYRSGVTAGVVAPKAAGFFAGVSTAFSTGALHSLEKGAILQKDAALHVSIFHGGFPGVSTQIAALRRLLKGHGKGALGDWFERVVDGEVPLVIDVHNADAIAALIRLKEEVEEELDAELKFVFAGATEAHLLAKEIAKAGAGVIIAPSRPFPHSWEQRRILPGPPLSEQNSVAALRAENVTVALGISGAWQARSTRFDIGWAELETGGSFDKHAALALATVNLEKLLGVTRGNEDLVATVGGDLLDFSSKVAAIISPGRGLVDIL
ncbi:carbohydrate esterase family 9 protein [Phanerochaete sordida]|uniref:Carbohydrate esterase family 9 protein n=1 Tax=Phanerochaete sordida TaxID=48140 RepID=A0A9P3GIA0_9APHY|nr:carbohydrate esterase family 9 protein [Phanerochaete sordida]